eukprot:TRINITY_DN11781_c0_g2_i1.p1 TRINITY_DN11781_c0_g2~~TRINITY_DN11781_c0_g2_i1.p1  ORF type:complete len:256 (+),score=40.94 TRINITY_DN11781_c0_g2_i1:139-906(+)
MLEPVTPTAADTSMTEVLHLTHHAAKDAKQVEDAFKAWMKDVKHDLSKIFVNKKEETALATVCVLTSEIHKLLMKSGVANVTIRRKVEVDTCRIVWLKPETSIDKAAETARIMKDMNPLGVAVNRAGRVGIRFRELDEDDARKWLEEHKLAEPKICTWVLEGVPGRNSINGSVCCAGTKKLDREDDSQHGQGEMAGNGERRRGTKRVWVRIQGSECIPEEVRTEGARRGQREADEGRSEEDSHKRNRKAHDWELC